MKLRVRLSKINLIILIFFIGYFIRYFTDLDVLYSFILFLIFSVVSFVYCVRDSSSIRIKNFYYLLIVVDLFAVIGILINKNHTLADAVLLIAWQTIGILLYKMRNNLRFTQRISVVMAIYLGCLVIYENFFVNKNQQVDIFFVSDRTGSNTVSILLILFFVIDLLWREQSKDRKVSYIYAIYICFIALCSKGVNGILTTILLMIGVYLTEESKSIKKLIKWIFVFGIVILVIVEHKIIFSGLQSFLVSGDIDTRLAMWTQYFALVKDSLMDILFGANISNVFLLEYYKNLHNTLFNWHYYFGLIPMVFFLFIVIKDIVGIVKRREYMYLAISCVMILRSITDETTYAFLPIWIYFACTNLDGYTSNKKRVGV